MRRLFFAFIWTVSLSVGQITVQALKFNRSHFLDLTDPCLRTGSYETILNRTHPAALLKLDLRYKTLVTYQSFDCIIKVKTEFHNKSREFYNENEDVAVMMFDINHGYRRKEDVIKLELVHIAKLDQNRTRFFNQKKKFQLPQYVPHSLPGYVLYGFEEIAQWNAESNSSISVNMKRWKSSGSIYFVFARYRIVSPYHCDTGIEVDCNDNSAVFTRCFPSALLPLFHDGLPFCEFHPLHALGSNRPPTPSPSSSESQVTPDSISIQSVGGLAMRPGGLLTVTEDVISQVKCVTWFSNPSPFISWSLGGRRLPSTSQTNSTEPGTNKWRSEAVLNYTFTKSDMGRKLVCLVEHVAYPTGSENSSVALDVLYKPRVRVDGDSVQSVSVHNRTVLRCHAQGNPEPKFQWLQRLPQVLGQEQVVKRGNESELVIEDAGYSDQGEYTCKAINTVGGERREATSEVVRLRVSGVPQVVKQVGDVVGVNGRDVRLEAEFCSQPLPLKNTWEWGGTVLPVGSWLYRKYEERLVEHPHKANCYISSLTVRGVRLRDSTET